MALLSDNKRRRVWKDLMSEGKFPPTISKVDLRAAVDAADVWMDGNWQGSTTVGFNPSLPQPYRGAETRKNKAYLMAKLALERAGEEV